MSNSIFAHTREAVRVKVKKCEPNLPPEWRKFSVDPQITSLEVLYSLLAKAFDIKSDFSIKYKAFDPAGNEIYLAVLSDWDLDAAFLRIHNVSIQTSTEPCLMLQIDIKPFTEVREWDPDAMNSPSSALIVTSSAGATPTSSTARELISPLQQSLGVSHKYVQQMQTKLPGLIMNQMGKTFSMVQKAFNLNEETMAVLPPRAPLADSEFRLFLDALGQIQRCDELRKVIFFGGIDPSLRRVVWKHILNVYPNVMNGHQRMDYMRRKSEQYYKLRETWKTAIKQGFVVGELAYVTSMVKKDVLRTDRLHPFYAGSDDNQNIASLFNILTTYALNHPSVSYCQGMSDIASPLLVTMNDEAQAYICFCAIMSRVRGNFMMDGIAMTQKFAHLTEALSYYDAEFWDYLKAQQADDLLFCYRWLLLELKREFPFEDALRMLEVQWSSLKYEASGAREELKLFEVEFVPIDETTATMVGGVATPSSIIGSGVGPPISPSYLLAKPRENAYTKVCALRRQSSSASLNSLSSSMSSSINHVPSGNTLNSKLDVTRRLNHSLDDNITRHATRRQRRTSSKAHQSLDETKMLKLLERRTETVESVLGGDHETTDDDVFTDTNHFNFHDTNPFKDDDGDDDGEPVTNLNAEKSIRKAFLSSSSSSIPGEDSNATTSTATEASNLSSDYNNVGGDDSSSDCNSPDSKTLQLPKGIAKLQNKNILSNYNAVSNIIAKQLATNVSEGVKRVSSTGGGHFRDLKEKIAATSKKGLSLDECNEKSQQKLVKNFNEFLNFAAMNKSRVGSVEKPNTAILVADITKTTAPNKSKTPSPTRNQISPTPPPHPLVQLTKGGFASSLEESDSSSLPDTTNNTWSCSTAATAIQQANNLSSNSLHLELNSQFSSLTHTPERTPLVERLKGQTTTATTTTQQIITPTKKPDTELSATPDEGQDLEYYPMTTAITRELRLEAENLDRQVFGDLIVMTDDDKKDSTTSISEIEYEKLGKDSLDMVEDLKENEIVACPDVNELLIRRRQRDITLAKTEESKSAHLLNGQIDRNLNIRDRESNKMLEAMKLNPFLDESLLRVEQLSTISSNNSIFTNSTSLPEVLVPISSTDAPDIVAVDEMATTAAEEEVTFSKVSQLRNPNQSPTPKLPPPAEFGGGNPFLMFLCLTLLLQHRNTIMKRNMDYNEIAMHFDKMVRKHDVTRVLNQARRMYIEYLKNQTTYNPEQQQQQQQHHQQQSQKQDQPQSINAQQHSQQLVNDVNRNQQHKYHQQQQQHSNHHYHTSSDHSSS